jgi:hypothetical protein
MLNSRTAFPQNFQRIQRNRQSRIRVKLCRRAGKRQDEVLLEEDSPTPPPPTIASPASSNHGGGGGSSGPSANHSEDIVDIDGEDSLASKAVRLEDSPSVSAVDRAAGKGTFSRD